MKINSELQAMSLKRKGAVFILAASCFLTALPISVGAMSYSSYSRGGESVDTALGYEDVISVQVIKHPEFSGDFLVPVGGRIDFPGAGGIQVIGMTVESLGKLLTTKLSQELKYPRVSVTLKQARALRVYVAGAVARAGIIDLKPGWRISEILSAAGGLGNLNKSAQDPSIQIADVTVFVDHPGSKAREKFSLEEVLHGEPDKNIEIKPGDLVTFEDTEQVPVYVMGDVKLPGVFRLRKPSCRLVEALSSAGGFNLDSATDRIQVTHLDGASSSYNLSEAVIQNGHAPIVPLRAGDVIYVPTYSGRIAVLGLVKTPGVFPLVAGRKMFLSDALGLAQGHNNSRARLSKIALVRLDEKGRSVRQLIDFGRFLRSGDSNLNPEIFPGDVVYVPETNSVDWSNVLQALSVTATAFSAGATSGIIK